METSTQEYHSWYRASLDPSCWRRLNFRSLDFTPWSPFSSAFALRYCLHSPLSFSSFLRFALHRSRGVVDQLAFPLSSAVSIHDLAYASVKCLRLKALALPDNLMLEDDLRIPELVRRWKDLEHLEMEIVGIFAPPILSSSRSCNLSFAIPISLPKPLSFATSSLPRLHSPPSRNPGPFRAQVSVSAAQKTKDRLPANLIVTETKGPHSTIRLNVDVPPAISQECYGEALDEFSKKAKVPGFRQGKKVPENILLNYIGRQNIQQAVVEATLKKTLPHAMSSFAYAGSSILGKLALGQGLSALVFVVYRHLIAMLILAPLAYVLERNRRPSFSFGVMLKIFILAMFGITIQQNVYYVGLHLISPTVASALGNVIPAFTFLLAIVLRMEMLNLKTVILLGAFVTSPMIQLHFESPEKGDAWLKGSALMLFGYFACSVSLVLQSTEVRIRIWQRSLEAANQGGRSWISSCCFPLIRAWTPSSLRRKFRSTGWRSAHFVPAGAEFSRSTSTAVKVLVLVPTAAYLEFQ
ncbi:hypothetical protein ZIOFF_024297 [Zingiber officinale]|uniref:peptidylprolyl isomerase n=1 Tax=Zingiber officinale TaxID=94328 RepID=A0A8J5L658_ZINOF|nr:hypothetical protein ZIOFF_024297 [Zingiber officinale]